MAGKEQTMALRDRIARNLAAQLMAANAKIRVGTAQPADFENAARAERDLAAFARQEATR